MIVHLLFLFLSMTSQIGVDCNEMKVKVGDIFEIGSTEYDSYKHIKFPRANFIIKRGGIPDFKNLVGERVMVIWVKKRKDGRTRIEIQKHDRSMFFGRFSSVGVDFEEAIESGELKKIK